MGAKSYTGVAWLHIQALRVANESRVGTAESDQDLINRGVGLDLLGKPREKDVEFISLRGMVFGSEEFRSTMIGQATMAAVEDVIGQLIALFQPNTARAASLRRRCCAVRGTGVEAGNRPVANPRAQVGHLYGSTNTAGMTRSEGLHPTPRGAILGRSFWE